MTIKNQTLINRVAGLTIFFWIIKILSTTVGETAADFIAVNMNIGLIRTTFLFATITTVAILWNLKQNKYFAPTYWLLIVMMSIEGTLITDILVDNLKINLITLNVLFTMCLFISFYVWYKEEDTLSIHKITNRKREIFYWIIVLITFALGTAIGDTVSELLEFGYLNSFILFGSTFSITTGLFYAKVLNGVTAFWIAFIVTRPIGASLGDLFIQMPSDGGMGISAETINIIFFTIIIAMVTYLTVSKIDIYFVSETEKV